MQTNNEWQPKGNDAVKPVEMPSNITSAESVATAGSNAYMTKDAEQENLNKTSSNTHIKLAEVCVEGGINDGDGLPTDQDDY